MVEGRTRGRRLDDEEGTLLEDRSGFVQLVVGVHKSPNPAGNGVLRPQRDITTAIIEACKFLHTYLVEEYGVAGIDLQRSRESEREAPQEKTKQEDRNT